MFFKERSGELPVLPLRDAIVFPKQVMPLLVGRPLSRSALLKAFHADKKILLVMQESGDVTHPTRDDLHEVGVESKIIQLLRMPDDNYKALIEGVKRVRIESISEKDDYWLAQFNDMEDAAAESTETLPLVRAIHSRFAELVALSPKIPSEMAPSIESIEVPGQLSDALIPYLPMSSEKRQTFLTNVDPVDRLQQILAFIQAEIDLLEIDQKIKNRVKDQMEQNQREYYLNEKMQAIQKELGDKEDGPKEFERLLRKIQDANLPEEAENRTYRELKRLKKMSPMSAEATVSRTYLDWILALPWSANTEENKDLISAQTILNDDHYGLFDIKERILEHLAVSQLNPKGRHPILCLVGPPGVGKTSLAKSIADATGRKYVRQALGGVRDESEIRGHRRTYIGSMPGKLVQSLRRAGVNNPVFLLDEIDKMANDFHHGDPSAALLEALDPEQNDTFRDHYLDLDFDLSKVLFICTANQLQGIPGPLQDRLEILQLNSYTELEKLIIAQKHLLPKQILENGLKPNQVNLSKSAYAHVIRCYTRESGVRNLERELAKIARKVARKQVESGEEIEVWLTPENLSELLGPEKYLDRDKDKPPTVGVVNGLAVTPWGGELLEIEVATAQGKGNLELTGRLGDWLKESAKTGLTYIRTKIEEFSLDPEFHSTTDMHIHYPGNALKTDGPSAGMAMTIAMISALSGKPVRSDVAMTGEISLRGRIFPIGGVKEKLLAAHRRQMKLALLPIENEKDLEDVPQIVKDEMEIRLVSHLDEALELIFEDNKKSL